MEIDNIIDIVRPHFIPTSLGLGLLYIYTGSNFLGQNSKFIICGCMLIAVILSILAINTDKGDKNIVDSQSGFTSNFNDLKAKDIINESKNIFQGFNRR
jgi:hypothetical protein